MNESQLTKAETTPLIFSAYPADKKSTKPNLRWFRNSPLLRKFALFAPLIIGLCLYRYTVSGPFLPLTCQLMGLGCPKIRVTGFTTPEYSRVKDIFTQNFINGDEVGASVTMYHNGVPVVDLKGGVADMATGKPYDNSTLQLVFSSSKAVTSIVIARLVEQGILNYDEYITTYWPEFGQGNKDKVTLGDLMVHRAGVGFIDHHKMTVSDLYDMDHLAKILQEQPHNFDGKPTRAYHAVTRGWYLNEIVRRQDPKHRTIGQIFEEELASTYNVEFHYKLPEELEPRIATLYQYPLLRILAKMLLPNWMVTEPLHEIFVDMMNPKSVPFKSLVATAPDQSQPGDYNRREFRIAEGPSYSGITNSHSMAKIAAIMANRGQPINPGEPAIFNETTYEITAQGLPPVYDETLHETMTPTKGGWGLWRLAGVEDAEFVGWGGSGGSLFLWSTELNVSFAYAMNACNTALLGDKRSLNMLRALVDIARELNTKNMS